MIIKSRIWVKFNPANIDIMMRSLRVIFKRCAKVANTLMMAKLYKEFVTGHKSPVTSNRKPVTGIYLMHDATIVIFNQIN